MNKDKAIVVYGASSNRIRPEYKEAAYELGRELARCGATLVSGGGRAGIMAASIEGAVSEGGRTIGVLPEFMVARDWQHPQLSEMISTPDMHSRKRTMSELTCGAIACAGGCGTFEELMEIITWRQLGLYKGSVVILNTLNYYDPLLEMLERGIAEGFIGESNRSIWRVASTPAEAVAMAFEPVESTDYSRKID